MPRKFIGILLLAMLPLGAFAQEKKAPEPLKLKAGDVAPDFTLLQYDGKGVKAVSLHDFRGKKQRREGREGTLLQV